MASQLIVWQKKSKLVCAIKVLSPAKLNLYLNITGRYSKNYHRIESIVERISLCDEIIIKKTFEPAVTISCSRRDLAVPDNLCVKAAMLMQKKFSLKCGFDIILKKNIPVGAGLGGGSSNAASTIIGISEMFKLKLSKSELYKLGAKLGSDVNFFLSESPYALMEGRGEKITPFSGKPLRHLVLWPGVHLSTKDVYANTHIKLTKLLSNVNILKYALKKGDRKLMEVSNFNILEKSALSLCSELKKVKRYFGQRGVDLRLTGSGSALYSFLSGDHLYHLIKKDLPGKWLLFSVRTF